MVQLCLSIMVKNPQESIDELYKLLSIFEAKTHIHVNIIMFPWSTAWSAINRYAMYGSGPDVSEVGTSWMGDLIEKKVLSPISQGLISSLGGENNFYPKVWRTCTDFDSSFIWAIPWFIETRLLYYRKDALEKAGIDAAGAFTTAESLEKTLACLQNDGNPIPWSVNTQREMKTIHAISSWIWGAGGDFFAPDGNKLAISQKETLDGMTAYYSLKKFMGGSEKKNPEWLPKNVFWEGQSCTTIDGQWIWPIKKRIMDKTFFDTVGVSQMPGVPFIGGSNLILWKNSKEPEAAQELIAFLTGEDVNLSYLNMAGHFSSRKDMIQPFLAGPSDPVYQTIHHAYRTGNNLPSTRRWGNLENRLVETFGNIWEEWLNPNSSNLREIITRHIHKLEKTTTSSLEIR